MLTIRSRLHRCWQARALRWTYVLGVLALVGCALPRRDAPPTIFSAATPVDFPADVRFLSTDRTSVEAKSTAALQRLRTLSKDGTLRALVLPGAGGGGASGAGALVGGEPARKLFRDVVVASASIPGVFEPVLIHVQQGGRLYDEMHVDGNASASLFIAPAAAYFALLDQRSLDGAQVYVLINGQIFDAPQTTPFRLRPIVARTFSVALKHMSRVQVVAVDQFAEKYRMSVKSTYLPFDYPKYSSADFRASTMRPLFEYGARCAQNGRLWTTLDETMDTVARAEPASKRVPVEQKVECPLRDVPFTARDRQ